MTSNEFNEKYKDHLEEDVQKLIDKGHISSLGKNISSTAFYTDRGQDLNFYSGDTIK